MRLLVLGGTRFAGRAVVVAAVAAGHQVTTLNRGVSRSPAAGVRQLTADRTDTGQLRAALGTGEWDAVIDTWSFAPSVVAAACELLTGRTGHYLYVSTISVYADPFPEGGDERAATVAADPDSTDGTEYQSAKRGCELAVRRVFGDEALLARPGLILGPYENIGRLPWWLRRIERGGQILAPGDPARPLQFIDVRDLAAWLLHNAEAKTAGTVNLSSRPGHTTMGELLSTAVQVTGSDGELVWAPQERLIEAGISPWTELPIWLPRGPDYDPMFAVDVSAAMATGLTCRPATETIRDTWAWLQAEGDPPPRLGQIGLDPAKEREVLDQLTGAGPG